MLDPIFSKEFFSNTKSKPLLAQLGVIYSCLVIVTCKKRLTPPGRNLLTDVVERDNMPCKTPFFAGWTMPGPSAAPHHTCLLDPSPAPFPFSGHAPNPQYLSVVWGSKLKTEFEVQAHLADRRSEYSPCIQIRYIFGIGSNPSTAHFQKTPEELLRSSSISWSHSSRLPREGRVYICTWPHELKYSFALLPPTF